MCRIDTCWDGCCWKSVGAFYTACFKNNCAGLGEEEGTEKPLEMRPYVPTSPIRTKQNDPSLQVQHWASTATLAFTPGPLAPSCWGWQPKSEHWIFSPIFAFENLPQCLKASHKITTTKVCVKILNWTNLSLWSLSDCTSFLGIKF